MPFLHRFHFIPRDRFNSICIGTVKQETKHLAGEIMVKPFNIAFNREEAVLPASDCQFREGVNQRRDVILLREISFSNEKEHGEKFLKSEADDDGRERAAKNREHGGAEK